jgi:hypothetical protein
MGWWSRKSVAEPLGRWKRLGDASSGVAGHVVRDVAFFALFYLYLCLVVEPHLIFHGSDRITNFPSFYTTWSFFVSHLSRPGGPVEYLSAFLSQLFYFSWLGALVLTVQAWAFTLLMACLVRRTGLPRLHAVAYVPALLLLALYGRYTYFFPTTMASLCALAPACVYLRSATGRTPAIGAVSFMVLALVCYYVAGAAMLVFALTCAIAELFVAGRRRLAVLYALVAGGWPYVFGVTIFGADVGNAYGELLPVSWRLLHFAARRRGVEMVHILYLLAPSVATAGGLVSALRTGERRASRVSEGRQPKDARVDRPRAVPACCAASPVCRWLASTLALVAVAAAVAWGSFDRTQKRHFAVDYYTYHAMWPQVLREGRQGREDPFVMHAVNRALYHTGRLGNEMFAWPQKPTYLLLPDPEHQWVYWQNFGVHLELGFVNFAENALMECLAGMGDRPMILQQLALINMVKGNPGTARVYLHKLSATLFHRGWARHYLRLLERDPDLATDTDVQGLRSIVMQEDYPALDLSAEDTLSRLLEKNGRNRMAFEYLMAWYLSNRQLTRFIKRLEGLRDLGYETLPRHYEEAVMVYTATARTTVQLSGYEPREEVQKEMRHFLEVLQSHGGDMQAARADLAKQHGNTYAFYNVYGPREKTR